MLRLFTQQQLAHFQAGTLSDNLKADRIFESERPSRTHAVVDGSQRISLAGGRFMQNVGSQVVTSIT